MNISFSKGTLFHEIKLGKTAAFVWNYNFENIRFSL